jgi:hypothetical protein
MITEPTTRHPSLSAYGLRMRILLVGAALTAVALGLAGAQPVAASSPDPRGPSAIAAPVAGPGARADGDTWSSGSGALSDGPPGASSDGPSGASSDGPSGAEGSSDWHLYNHWTDPSWPLPDQLRGHEPGGAPWPTSTSGYGWTPPVLPPGLPPTAPPTGLPTAPPTGLPPSASSPSADPPSADVAETPEPGAAPNVPRPGAPGSPAPTGEPGARDPVAAGPQDPDLGLGDPVDPPSPTPLPATTTPVPPGQATPPILNAASDYQRTLIFSGALGLALAAIGFAMISVRRRRW